MHRLEDILGGGGGISTGVIVMWGQNQALIPKGWALCNGDNGTPVMLGLMVKGAPGELYTDSYRAITQYTSVGIIGGEATAIITTSAGFTTTFQTGSNLQLTFIGTTFTIAQHASIGMLSTHAVTQPASHSPHNITYDAHANHIVTNPASHGGAAHTIAHVHFSCAIIASANSKELLLAVGGNHGTHPGHTEVHDASVDAHTTHSPFSFQHNDHVITVTDDGVADGHIRDNLFGSHAGADQTIAGTIQATAIYADSHLHTIDLRPSFRRLYYIMRL